jgi:subtilisin family serine protease
MSASAAVGISAERTSLRPRFDVVLGVRAVTVLATAFLFLAVASPAAERPIVVAVVDSGVDPAVPGLVTGYNAVDGSGNTRDELGHGTGVAGVIAAGIAGCQNCRIMPVKIADESGSSTQGTIAAGIRWAAEHGARVINLSYGLALGARSTGAVERAIASAIAVGATVTTGAMNDGTRDPNVNPWASGSPDAVRVTAVDDQGRLLPASNHGIWVDIGARGTATSNAAPRVAAAAALVLSAHPGLTALQVRAALRRGCAPTPALDVGWHCVLDVAGAVKAGAASTPTYRLTVVRAGTGFGTVGASGAAIQCGLFCRDRLDGGTVVTLTAAPIRGSRFVGWRGACRSSRPSCVVRMAGPATAVAVFAKTRS